MSTTHVIEFFPGFAWAVPKAFRRALSSCLFETGDTLYDAPKAYEGAWGEASRHIRFSIQVSGATPGIPVADEDAATVFCDNWTRGLELDLTEYPSRTVRRLTTTQGRLFKSLWHGDLTYLGSADEPPVPKLGKDLLTEIPTTVGFFRRHYGANLKHPVIFIMPFDETSDLLCDKRREVENFLAAPFHPRTIYVTPKEAGFPNSASFVPTVRIACFVMDTTAVPQVFAQLKAALYGPSKRKTQTDRFQLDKHGHLHPPPIGG